MPTWTTTPGKASSASSPPPGLLHVDLAEHGALNSPKRPGRAAGQQAVGTAPLARRAGSRTRAPVSGASRRPRGLFETLRRWRSDTAGNRAFPPTSSCTTAACELAAVCPTSRSHLASIAGIGSAKIERYGDDLLALVRPPLKAGHFSAAFFGGLPADGFPPE